MDRQEHLLTCLAEECAEVMQRVSKALRFGLDEVQSGQSLTNADRIAEELRDLFSVANVLRDMNVLPGFMPDVYDVDAKLAKIEHFMAIGREQGVLS